MSGAWIVACLFLAKGVGEFIISSVGDEVLVGVRWQWRLKLWRMPQVKPKDSACCCRCFTGKHHVLCVFIVTASITYPQGQVNQQRQDLSPNSVHDVAVPSVWFPGRSMPCVSRFVFYWLPQSVPNGHPIPAAGTVLSFHFQAYPFSVEASGRAVRISRVFRT